MYSQVQSSTSDTPLTQGSASEPSGQRQSLASVCSRQDQHTISERKPTRLCPTRTQQPRPPHLGGARERQATTPPKPARLASGSQLRKGVQTLEQQLKSTHAKLTVMTAERDAYKAELVAAQSEAAEFRLEVAELGLRERTAKNTAASLQAQQQMLEAAR